MVHLSTTRSTVRRLQRGRGRLCLASMNRACGLRSRDDQGRGASVGAVQSALASPDGCQRRSIGPRKRWSEIESCRSVHLGGATFRWQSAPACRWRLHQRGADRLGAVKVTVMAPHSYRALTGWKNRCRHGTTAGIRFPSMVRSEAGEKADALLQATFAVGPGEVGQQFG